MEAATLELRETVDLRLLANLSENFRSPYEALFELVDNALASRIEDEQVTVAISGSSARKGSIKVISRGGTGMGRAELAAFLRWGKPAPKLGLNRYGQGGKAAIGYLGTGCRIRANRHGESTGYLIEDTAWLARPDGQETTFLAPTVPAAIPGVGVVEIEVLGVRRAINYRRLERELAWRYRPALCEGALRLLVRGRKVAPAPLPTDVRAEFDERLTISAESGEPRLARLRGWVGIGSDEFEGRGGVRCSAHGRVVTETEYFGHRSASFKASLNKLIGEVDLSFVPVLLNKNAFDVASPEWQAVEPVVHREMSPYVEKLLRRKETHQPSEQERERAMEARDLAHNALLQLAEETAQQGTGGAASGRKPPIATTGQAKRGGVGKKNRETSPRTPPPRDAVGRLARSGIEVDWDVRSLDPKVRSARISEGGRTEVVINSEFPLYKERGGDTLYMLETGLLEELQGDDGRLASDYYSTVNDALGAALTDLRPKKKRRSRTPA